MKIYLIEFTTHHFALRIFDLMVPFDSLEKADSNGTSKHAYLCYFEVVRTKNRKRPKNGHFFEIQKKPRKH